MTELTSPESVLRDLFEQVRPAIDALQRAWQQRVEGARLREYVAAIEAGLATIEATERSPAYIAATELLDFLEAAKRRYVSGPIMPAGRGVYAMIERWDLWIGGMHPEFQLTRIDPADAAELHALMEAEQRR